MGSLSANRMLVICKPIRALHVSLFVSSWVWSLIIQKRQDSRDQRWVQFRKIFYREIEISCFLGLSLIFIVYIPNQANNIPVVLSSSPI